MLEGNQFKVDVKVDQAPYPETLIKDSSNGGRVVRDFVRTNIDEIKESYDFTTIFIDTDKEYQRYGVTVPSVALICTDMRKTLASLKRDPLVIKFNKSKTLKRVTDWQKGKITGFDRVVWYSIYSSAKDYHAVAMNEAEEDEMLYEADRLSHDQIKWLFANGAATSKNGKVEIDWDKADKAGWKKEWGSSKSPISGKKSAFDDVSAKARTNLFLNTDIITKVDAKGKRTILNIAKKYGNDDNAEMSQGDIARYRIAIEADYHKSARRNVKSQALSSAMKTCKTIGEVKKVAEKLYSGEFDKPDSKRKMLEDYNDDLKYVGYLNEEGNLCVPPSVGDSLVVSGREYILEEVNDLYVYSDGVSIISLDETECNSEVTLDESVMSGVNIGDDLTIIGLLDEAVVVSDGNDRCYLYEGSLEVVNNGVKNGKLSLTINGKEYLYVSDDYSAEELSDKFDSLAKYSQGKALAWVKKNSSVTEKDSQESEKVQESVTIDGIRDILEKAGFSTALSCDDTIAISVKDNNKNLYSRVCYFSVSRNELYFSFTSNSVFKVKISKDFEELPKKIIDFLKSELNNAIKNNVGIVNQYIYNHVVELVFMLEKLGESVAKTDLEKIGRIVNNPKNHVEDDNFKPYKESWEKFLKGKGIDWSYNKPDFHINLSDAIWVEFCKNVLDTIGARLEKKPFNAKRTESLTSKPTKTGNVWSVGYSFENNDKEEVGFVWINLEMIAGKSGAVMYRCYLAKEDGTLIRIWGDKRQYLYKGVGELELNGTKLGSSYARRISRVSPETFFD